MGRAWVEINGAERVLLSRCLSGVRFGKSVVIGLTNCWERRPTRLIQRRSP